MAVKKSDIESTEKPKAKAKEADDGKVAIMLPYIEGEDREVTVGVNGVYTKIRKGVVVRVSPEVAEVLENSNQQMMRALDNQEKFKMQRTDL